MTEEPLFSSLNSAAVSGRPLSVEAPGAGAAGGGGGRGGAAGADGADGAADAAKDFASPPYHAK